MIFQSDMGCNERIFLISSLFLAYLFEKTEKTG